MGWHPNEDKGTLPTMNAIGYEMKHDNGDVEVATVLAWKLDRDGRNYRAFIATANCGVELMTPEEGRLRGKRPIIAVTQDDIPALIEQIVAAMTERYEARIVAIEAKLGRSIVPSATLTEAKASTQPAPKAVKASTKQTTQHLIRTCGTCGERFANIGLLRSHQQASHAKPAEAPATA